jgi:hypothetical protein
MTSAIYSVELSGNLLVVACLDNKIVLDVNRHILRQEKVDAVYFLDEPNLLRSISGELIGDGKPVLMERHKVLRMLSAKWRDMLDVEVIGLFASLMGKPSFSAEFNFVMKNKMVVKLIYYENLPKKINNPGAIILSGREFENTNGGYNIIRDGLGQIRELDLEEFSEIGMESVTFRLIQ